jgi:outer membrane protein OmpA-like peptidoglycan-associated protein
MRKPSAPFFAAVGLAVIAAGAGSAHAQRGVDSEIFRPALDSYGIFTVDRAQTSHQWDWGFKLYVDYAQNPLRLNICPVADACSTAMSQKPALNPVIGWQAVMHFGFHLGLTDWLEFVADLPVSAEGYTANYGDYGSAGAIPPAGATGPQRTGFYAGSGYTNVPPPDAAPLDWRIGFKARLFRAGMFGVAAAAVVSLPFGDDSAFLGDGGFTFRPMLIADVTHGAVTAAINIGAIIRPETIVLAPNDQAPSGMAAAAPRTLIDVGDELTWSAGVSYRFVRWVGVAAEIYGLVPLVSTSFSNHLLDAGKDYTADVAGGFQFFPVKDIAVGVGAGAGIISAAMRHDDFRVFGGVTWAPAEGKGAVAAGGIDTDGDGIPDGQDLCPTEAEDKDGFDDEDGCPDPDNDQDGIPDKLDKCPNEPEDKDGFQDDDGCPEVDNDGDGIPDAQDKCPNDAEDKDGFQDDDGCPDLDNDGDGIPDSADKCPNEPETRNGVDDDDGCPDSGGQVTIAGGKIELPENINFETGSDKISGRSESLMDRIAEKIKANPQVKRIRIEGHTDDVGGARKNQELSQARAESVRNFLIRKGVEPERLQAVGYGDTRPLDKRKTADARAKNRRVEFIIVEQ